MEVTFWRDLRSQASGSKWAAGSRHGKGRRSEWRALWCSRVVRGGSARPAAVGSGDGGGDESDVDVIEVAEAAGEVDGDVVVGEAGGYTQDGDGGGGEGEMTG